MNNRKIYNEIRVLQVKLNQNIDKKGLTDKKTVELSNRIDELVNYYYYLTTKIRKYSNN